MKLPGCEGVYRSCALGGDFQMAYTALSLTFGAYQCPARVRWLSILTSGQDVPAFVAIILFSHPWRRNEIVSIIQRTMCQDSTAYFLSVLSIQIFVTVAISSGAAVSPNG